MINPLRKQKVEKETGGNLNKPDYDIIAATRANKIEDVYAAIGDDDSCVKDSDRNGMTALHWAAALNNYAISEVLLKNKHTPKEAVDNFGRQPMQLALEHGHEELNELFFRHVFPEVYEQDDPYNSEGKIIPFKPTDSKPS